MSGFNFGGFDLTSGFNSLSEIGDKLQKLKEDVESTIDASLNSAQDQPSGSGGTAEDGDGDWLGFDVLRTLVSAIDETGEQPEGESAAEDSINDIDGVEFMPMTEETSSSPPLAPSSSQTAAPLNEQVKDISAEPDFFEDTNVEKSDSMHLEAKSSSMQPSEEETLTQPPLDSPGSSAGAAASAVAAAVAGVEESEVQSSSNTLIAEDAAENAAAPAAAAPSMLPPSDAASVVNHRGPKEEAAAVVAEGLEAAAATVSVRKLPPKEEGTKESIVRPSKAERLTSNMGQPPVAAAAAAADLNALSKEDLKGLIGTVQETLRVRESQLERQAQEASAAAAALAALTKKNEELVLAKAAVSEKDVEDMRREFEARLAASERKAAALAKERDALRRGNKAKNAEELLKQKDEEIRQIMEEGEILSKKQLAQETTIKQLRGRIKELKEEVESVSNKLENERERALNAEQARESTAAEMAALQERQVEQLAAERQHFERLLGEARTTAAVAEKRAEEAVKAGAAKKLRDAELKVEALEGTVEQLREELERKRAAADEREDMLSTEVSELQRRCAEAEARQQELQSRLPEATAPLLRQLETMQNAAEAASVAAAETEKALQSRINAAEAAAVESKEAAAAAAAELTEMEARVAAAEEQLKLAREQVKAAEEEVTQEVKLREAAESVVDQLRSDVAAAQESLSTLEKVYAQQMEALQTKEAEAARAAAALREELRSRQAQSQSQAQPGSGQSAAASGEGQDAAAAPPQPPALAAPGFKWVMVREGEDHQGIAGEGTAAAEGTQGAELPTGAPLWNGTSAAGDASSGGLVSALAAATRSSKTSDNAALAALQRTVQDLEATRDRLSEELVRAEGEAAAGRATGARVAALEVEVAALQQRYHSAVELLGEREEKIEELVADIMEMREGYRQQVALLADEIERLRQRVLELETVK